MKITTVVMTVLCLMLSNLSSAQKLKTYDYADGDFSIDFPAAPKTQVDKDRVILTAVEKKTNTIYQVIYYTKKYDVSNAKDWYDNAILPYGKEDGSRKDLSNQDLKGKAAKASSNGYNFKIQVWLGRNHCWVFAVANAGKYPSETVANTYFESFKPKGKATTNSSSTATTTTSNATPDFDLGSYFKSKSFPHISNINSANVWDDYSQLQYFLKLDVPEMLQMISKYGEGQVSQSYSGKKAIQFIKDFKALSNQYPAFIEAALTPAKEQTGNLVSGNPRLSYLNTVATLGQHFLSLSDDEATKKAAQQAKDLYDKTIVAAPYIKNNFHKNHLNKVV
ncbi:MAG: hypothetical protein GY810_21955 [Aureispira sp.]|nr:hypothetical protein [Aureispira sp.]